MDRREALGSILLSVITCASGSGRAARAEDREGEAEAIRHRANVRLINPHKIGTQAVVFSPDGERFVTRGQRDSTPKVWDATTGRELFELGGLQVSPYAIAFRPDGAEILSTGSERIETIEGPGNVVFSPTGSRISTWDAATGRRLRALSGNSAAVGELAIGADGREIAILDGANMLSLRDALSGREIVALSGRSAEGNRHIVARGSVAFDARARRVACSTIEVDEPDRGPHRTFLKLWDLDRSRLRNVDTATSLGMDSAGRDCLLSPDGSLVITSYYDQGGNPFGPAIGLQKVAMIDFDTATVIRHTRPDLERYESLVAISPDGRWFVSARQEGILRIWDVASGRVARTIRGPEGVAVPKQEQRTILTRAVAFMPWGLRGASGGFHSWSEPNEATGTTKDVSGSSMVLKVEPLLIWDAEFAWDRPIRDVTPRGD